MTPEQPTPIQKLLSTQPGLSKIKQHSMIASTRGLFGTPKPTSFELASNQDNPKDIKGINKDFDEIYGHENRNDGVYHFPSHLEAEKFFKQQAQSERTYLVKQADVDILLYSSAEGQFFKGSQDEFDRFLEALIDNPNIEPLHPTTTTESDPMDRQSIMAMGG